MIPSFNFEQHPHRRYNPLIDEWVQVSPHRTRRPWRGLEQPADNDARPPHDPDCYLCPGNMRTSGERNPHYANTFVFDNDFPGLTLHPPPVEESHPLLRAQTIGGVCRVVCFTPRHDLTLPEMSLPAIAHVIDTWIRQTIELGNKYCWVQLFENKGALMGNSNPHPHGQIWALDLLPNEPRKEDRQMRQYWRAKGMPLLVDYVNLESGLGERIVVENEHWLAIVPFWAIWPFETMLLPRRHVGRLPDLNQAERVSLGEVLKRLLTRYDNLFQTSFPYSMGWHGAPFVDEPQDHWQLHAHFYPPLLRSATIKKYMVGYEMLGEEMRDITAEDAAARLRAQTDRHYKDSTGSGDS